MNRIKEAQKSVPREGKVEQALRNLNDEELKDAWELLRDTVGYSHTYVAKVLTEAGFPCERKAVRRFREQVLKLNEV